MPNDGGSSREALIEGLAKGLAVIERGGAVWFSRGGAVFYLSSCSQAAIDELLFNPFAAVRRPWLVDYQLGSRPGLSLAELPGPLAEALPRLDAELMRPKREIVDRYIERLRAGGSVSAGPTSDQMQTVRAAGNGFVVEGYGPADEGYPRFERAMSEAEVRAFLTSYVGFGLSD